MKKEKEKSGFSNFRYMMKMLWSSSKSTVIYTIYKNLAENVFYVFFFVYMTQYIYTCIEQRTPFNELFWFVLVLCILHIVIHFVSAGHGYLLKVKIPEIYRSFFTKVIRKASKMKYESFESPGFYDKFTRALDETVSRGVDMLHELSYFLGCTFAAVLAMGVVISVDWVLLLFIIPSILASFLFGSLESKCYYKIDLESTRDKRMGEYVKRVFYEKKYAGEIRLFNIRNVLFKRHKDAYDGIYATTKKHTKKLSRYNFLRWTIFVAASLSLPMLYVAYIVKTNPAAPIASYVAMITALEFVSGNISDAVEHGINTFRHALYAKNMRSFLEEQSEADYSDRHEVEGTLDDIRFENVSFTYNGSEKPTIKNMSFEIKKGERVAFVGHNGAGKTTLVKLLMGLYDVTDGKITVSNTDISELEPKSYHSHFGTVFQDLQIFALPISQNVLMHEPRNEEERALVIEALEKAQFANKLAKLPKGIDSMVTKEFDDEGVALSGGEAQKIAIARVFAKNPDIVILDEPSSALDPIAEYNMYKNMMELAEDKTVIFISHRLSSARVADRIFMLEQGEIIEQGTHDELMEQNGKYAAMFYLQAQNYQESLPDDMEVMRNG